MKESRGSVRLTMTQALVKHLAAQFIEIDGRRVRLFGGGFAIFGHGNVICLGEALHAHREALPLWRGQNEQSMAMAAVAYAKQKLRKRFMFATASAGSRDDQHADFGRDRAYQSVCRCCCSAATLS